MKYIVLSGRILFGVIFLMSMPHHFMQQGISYAQSAGVPYPSVLVPISGIMLLLGSLSIMLGYKAKWGGWLIALFLIPVTLFMHRFWTVTDPMMAQFQMGMFMKNISMLGGAFIITYFGAGPLSIDAWQSRHHVAEKEEHHKMAA